MYLPRRATTGWILQSCRRGGAGIFPLRVLGDVCTITQAYKFLNSSQGIIRDVALSTLKATVARKLSREVMHSDIVKYLNGCKDGEFSKIVPDYTSLWSRARMAIQSLHLGTVCRWQDEIGGSLSLTMNNETIAVGAAERELKDQLREVWMSEMANKKFQGRSVKAIAANSDSNFFVTKGDFTRFCDWRFVHRARHGLLPVNANRPWSRDISGLCRKCGKQMESAAHVLNHCLPNMQLITKRHNRVLDRLEAALPPKVDVRRECTVHGSGVSLKPDLVILNEEKKRVAIIDVAVCYEGNPTALEQSRQAKIMKYEVLANHYSGQGYEVLNDAVVFGSLGAMHPETKNIFKKLDINQNYARLMLKLMISDIIKISRTIYVAHVSGRQQSLSFLRHLRRRKTCK